MAQNSKNSKDSKNFDNNKARQHLLQDNVDKSGLGSFQPNSDHKEALLKAARSGQLRPGKHTGHLAAELLPKSSAQPANGPRFLRSPYTKFAIPAGLAAALAVVLYLNLVQTKSFFKPVLLVRGGPAQAVPTRPSLQPGQLVVTATAEAALFSLGDKSAVTITPNSRIELLEKDQAYKKCQALTNQSCRFGGGIIVHRGGLIVELNEQAPGKGLLVSTVDGAVLIYGTTVFIKKEKASTVIHLVQGTADLVVSHTKQKLVPGSWLRTQAKKISPFQPTTGLVHWAQSYQSMATGAQTKSTKDLTKGLTSVIDSAPPAETRTPGAKSQKAKTYEVITLKDGSVLTGKVIQKNGSKMVLKTKEGILEFSPQDVQSISIKEEP